MNHKIHNKISKAKKYLNKKAKLDWNIYTIQGNIKTHESSNTEMKNFYNKLEEIYNLKIINKFINEKKY